MLTGLFRNVAELQPDNSYIVLANRQKASIHPTSVLHGKKAKCVLFSEILTTSKNCLRHVTEIESSWINEVNPEIKNGAVSIFRK
jgi:hypothetical protein